MMNYWKDIIYDCNSNSNLIKINMQDFYEEYFPSNYTKHIQPFLEFLNDQGYIKFEDHHICPNDYIRLNFHFDFLSSLISLTDPETVGKLDITAKYPPYYISNKVECYIKGFMKLATKHYGTTQNFTPCNFETTDTSLDVLSFEYTPGLNIGKLESDVNTLASLCKTPVFSIRAIHHKSILEVYFGIETRTSAGQYLLGAKLMSDDFVQDELFNLPIGRELVSGVDIFTHIASTSSSHTALVGQNGSGKSRFLKHLIYMAMKNHTPEQIQIAILDATNEEFCNLEYDKKYGKNPYIIEETYGEFYNQGLDPSLQTLERIEIASLAISSIKTLIAKRQQIAVKAGFSTVVEYNTRQKDKSKRFPQLLIIMEEYACTSLHNSGGASRTMVEEYKDFAKEMAKNGRKHGVTMFYSSQNPNDVYTFAPEITNMIAFTLKSKRDYNEFFGEPIPSSMHPKGSMLCYFKNDEFELCELKVPAITYDHTDFDKIWGLIQKRSKFSKAKSTKAIHPSSTKTKVVGGSKTPTKTVKLMPIPVKKVISKVTTPVKTSKVITKVISTKTPIKLPQPTPSIKPITKPITSKVKPKAPDLKSKVKKVIKIK